MKEVDESDKKWMNVNESVANYNEDTLPFSILEMFFASVSWTALCGTFASIDEKWSHEEQMSNEHKYTYYIYKSFNSDFVQGKGSR